MAGSETGDHVVVGLRWKASPAAADPGQVTAFTGPGDGPRGDRGLARLISSAAATRRGAGDLISHIPSRTATGRHWAAVVASLTAAAADDATDAADVEGRTGENQSCISDDGSHTRHFRLFVTRLICD